MSKINFGLTPHGKHVLVNLRYNDLEIDEEVFTFFRNEILANKETWTNKENSEGCIPLWHLLKHNYYNNLSFKVYEVPCMKFDKNHGIKYQSTKKVVKIIKKQPSAMKLRVSPRKVAKKSTSNIVRLGSIEKSKETSKKSKERTG